MTTRNIEIVDNPNKKIGGRVLRSMNDETGRVEYFDGNGFSPLSRYPARSFNCESEAETVRGMLTQISI